MPIDPSIPLAVKVPEQASPIQTIGGLMQVRDAASQIALRNAQTQASQQQAADVAEQTAQRRRENQSTLQLQELMKNPDVQSKAAAGDFSAIYNAGISPTVANAAIKNIQDQRTTAQSIDKTKLENYVTQRGLLKNMLQGVSSETDDAISASQYNSGRQNLMQVAPDLAKNLPILQPGQNYRQQLDALGNTNGLHQAILQDAASLAKTNAETTDLTAKTNASNAAAGLDLAKTPGETADSQRKQLITRAMQDAQAGIQNGMHPIDAILGKIDPAAAAAYKPAYDTALANGGPEAAKSILEAAATHAGSIALATNPQVKAAEVAKQVEIERQTLPMKMQEHIAAAVSSARAMMGTGATANVPPHLAPVAIKDFEKYSNDYVGALTAADTMQTVINDARKGNKIAYSYAPTLGVLTINTSEGVKRVNLPEIQSYAGAGSTFDAIQSFFGKTTSGASIPKNILDNMAQFHGDLANVAKDTYQRKLQVTNSAYGSTFQPLDFAPKSQGGGAPQFKVGDTVIYNGTPHKVTGMQNGKLVLDGTQ